MFFYPKIDGLVIFEPQVFQDERGFFYEGYNKEFLAKNGIIADFVQDNLSYSKYGTVRGLHLQTNEQAQAKLVTVLQGEVFDVAVDLRKNSKTYGMHFGVHLSAHNKKRFFIPKGFAHGFSTLSESALFSYKVDNYYCKKAENGIIYNDEDLKIDWQLPKQDIIVSSKDLELKAFKEYKA